MLRAAVVLFLALALAVAPAQQGSVSRVSSSYLNLHNWVAEKDPDSLRLVQDWSSALQPLIVDIEREYQRCEDGEHDHNNWASDWQGLQLAYWTMFQEIKDDAAAVALANEHRRQCVYLVDSASSYFETNCPGAPSPPDIPETGGEIWTVAPDGSGWLIENSDATIIKRTNEFPLATWWGADSWSTSSRNRPPMKEPGDTLVMAPGAYPHDRITHSYDPADPVTTIRAQVPLSAYIQPNPVGGSDSFYVERGGRLHIEGLTFFGSTRSCVKGESRQWPEGMIDWTFKDCRIMGGWNATTNAISPPSRDPLWGYHFYNNDGLVISGPIGAWQGWIRKEHFAYLHSVLEGGCLVEDLWVSWCGRTFFQLVNRAGESLPSVGPVTIRNCLVADVCLESGGGGSAITIKAHRGPIFIENVVVRLGMNENLHPSVRGNITGSLVLEEAGRGPCLSAVVKDCTFEVGLHYQGTGAARRTNFKVEACEYLTVENTIIRSYPGVRQPAFYIDGTKLSPEPGSCRLDDDNEVMGECLIVGVGRFNTYDALIQHLKDNADDYPQYEIF